MIDRFAVILLFSMLFACSKESGNQQKTNESIEPDKNIKTIQKDIESTEFKSREVFQADYKSLSSLVDSKISLKGVLTGEKFEHLVYFHPPFSEIAHFNLSPEYPFYSEMPHIVIYFKRKTDLSTIYSRFMDKPAVISGTLGKVTGAMADIDPEKVKQRLEHTLYFLDVEKIETQ